MSPDAGPGRPALNDAVVDLAVIVVSWNVKDHLARCLDSLRAAIADDGVNALVWVVDSASSDDTVEMVRRAHPWVTLEPSDTNVGFVGGNNLALDRLRGRARYFWLLNPDTIVPRGTIRQLLMFLNGHPGAGLVSPKLLNTDGSLQECAFRFPGIGQAFFSLGLMPERLYYTAINGRYPATWFSRDRAFQIDHPLGAAMMARAEAIDGVGLLDAEFFMYCEEIDWAWRMQKGGWERWLLPSAVVTHVGGASTVQAQAEATRHLWGSRARLYRKHRGSLTRAVVRRAVRSVFAARRSETGDEAWIAAYDAILGAWA